MGTGINSENMHHRHYLYFKLYVSSYEKNRCFGRFLFFYAYIPTALFVHRYLQSSIPQPTPDLCPNTNNFGCTLNGHTTTSFTFTATVSSLIAFPSVGLFRLESSYGFYVCDHCTGGAIFSGY